MEIEIGEVVSTVRVVDANSILSPRTMETIVRAVLNAAHDQREHEKRAADERRVSGGVTHDQTREES